MPDIINRLEECYEKIAEKAGSQAYIIVAGYPGLFGKHIGAIFDPEDVRIVNGAVELFNEKIEEQVKKCKDKIKIEFVSVWDEFYGRGAYSIYSSYINGISTLKKQDINDKVSPPISSYSMHPNLDGAKQYAKCVQKKIDEIERKKNKISTDSDTKSSTSSKNDGNSSKKSEKNKKSETTSQTAENEKISSTNTSQQTEEEHLHAAFVSAKGNRKEIYFFYDDFDGDGSKEAYGITGDSTETSYNNVAVYYISNSAFVTQCDSSDKTGTGTLMSGFLQKYGYGDLLKAGNSKFIVWIENYGGSGSIAHIYGVKNGQAYEPQISKCYDYVSYVDYDLGNSNKFVMGKNDHSTGGLNFIEYYYQFDIESREFVEIINENSNETNSIESHSDTTNNNDDGNEYLDNTSTLKYTALSEDDYVSLINGNLNKEQLELVLAYIENDMAVNGISDSESKDLVVNWGAEILEMEGSYGFTNDGTEQHWVKLSVNDFNRMFSSFGVYRIDDSGVYGYDDKTKGTYADGDTLYVALATPKERKNAQITNAKYNNDEIIIEYNYTCQTHGILTVSENRKAVLNNTGNGTFRIISIETI